MLPSLNKVFVVVVVVVVVVHEQHNCIEDVLIC